jgi:(1->4)-alpha-D-glucan 1-alpha-D-glucosylmutase
MPRHAALREKGPDANDAYLLYQTLVGAWPLEVERAQSFMLKAVREAARHTSWTDPNESYEAGLRSFVTSVFADAAFVEECAVLSTRLERIARRSSLAQTLLKLTAPGVPDLYQGSELGELSLVDPDNRRPVDFGHRSRLLNEVATLSADDVLLHADVGLPKLWLIWKVLTLRRERPDLFAGDYEPLYASGQSAGRIVAFMRNGRLIAVAPRLIGEAGTIDALLRLPEGTWRNLLSESVNLHSGDLLISNLLYPFPVALLVRDGA